MKIHDQPETPDEPDMVDLYLTDALRLEGSFPSVVENLEHVAWRARENLTEDDMDILVTRMAGYRWSKGRFREEEPLPRHPYKVPDLHLDSVFCTYLEDWVPIDMERRVLRRDFGCEDEPV